MYELDIEDIRKPDKIRTEDRQQSHSFEMSVKKSNRTALPIGEKKLASLMRQFFIIMHVDDMRASDLSARHMRVVLQSKLARTYFFHRRIIVKVHASIHKFYTTETEELENMERDYMLRVLQKKLMNEARRVLGSEYIAELEKSVEEEFEKINQKKLDAYAKRKE